MTFRLDDVVPWGRSFDEYRAMFGLTDADVRGRILGCGDGPASFNATATSRGCRVVSIDPIYQFSSAQIRARVESTARVVADEARRNAHEFVWTHFASVEALIDGRLGTMEEFLADFDRAGRGRRYVAAALPALPFASRSFDLAVCSHFLFLYSAQRDARFHVDALVELCRVARDVRVFPLLELNSQPSRHLDDVTAELATRGIEAARVSVPYEFQRGGDEMLRVRARRA